MRSLKNRATIPVLVVALLLLTGCEGDGTSSDPDTSPSAEPEPSSPSEPAPPGDIGEGEGSPSSDEGIDAETLAILNCLDGKWEIDKSSDLWDLPYGDADEARGTIYIYFDPVSGFMLEYDDVYVYTEIADLTGHESIVTANGASIGTYDIDDEGYVVTEITDPGIAVVGDLHSIFSEDYSEGTVGEFVEMFYKCDGETLLGYPALTGDTDEPLAVYRLVERIIGG